MRRARLDPLGGVAALALVSVLAGCAPAASHSEWGAEASERFVREVRYQASPDGVDDATLLGAGDRVCRELLDWTELGDLDALTASIAADGLEPYAAKIVVLFAPARLCPAAAEHLGALREAAGVEEPHIVARRDAVEQSVANAVDAVESVLATHGRPASPEVTTPGEDGGTAAILDGGVQIGDFAVRAGARVRIEFAEDGFTVTGQTDLLPGEWLVYDSRTGTLEWRE